MKVYLAARFSRLPELVQYADELEAESITVTSRWLRGGHEWVGTIRDDCLAANVPFFFKQWGGRTPKAGGRDLDDRTWDEFPDVRRCS